MDTTQQTLIEMTHPLFWQGYQEGRTRCLREQYVLTDSDLLKYLRFPFRRSKRKPAKEREKDLYFSIGRLVGEMSTCVLPRQPYEEAVQDLQEKGAFPQQQQPLTMTHPLFKKGYQEGRAHALREQCVLTDADLVTGLSFAFLPRKHMSQEEEEENLYYEVGRLVGEMSGYALPAQPHEDERETLQEAFLARIKPRYPRSGEALVKMIRQFWIVQDQLAHTLNAETFEEMITCGRDVGNPLAASET